MIDVIEKPVFTPQAPLLSVAEKLERLVRDQGVAETATVDHIDGIGRSLWADDAEFESFLSSVAATRAEKG